MCDLPATAESLLRSLGLTSSQAAVLNSGSETSPKLLVYVFAPRVSVKGMHVRSWCGLPVEFVRMKRPKPLDRRVAAFA